MGLVHLPIDWQNVDTEQWGKIYFIQMGKIGPIKIGWSKKPEKRLAILQISNPYPLRILYFCEGSRESEKMLHSHFDQWHMNGEWYHPDRKIFKYIYECMFNDEWHRWLKPEEKSLNPPQSRIDYIHSKVMHRQEFANLLI